jgi:hypothetical protein
MIAGSGGEGLLTAGSLPEPWTEEVADEDITPMDTNNTPQVDIQGPITRARARQLNL